MDPTSMMQGGMTLVGLGTSIYGMLGASKEASNVASAQQQIGQDEIAQNALRQQQMTLNFHRQSMENLRNTQKSVAMNRAAATNQGSQFGSGLAGGTAGAIDSGGLNQLNASQNFMLGNKMFNLDNSIDQLRMSVASDYSKMNTYQGISQLGSAITQSSGSFSRLAGNFGGTTGVNPDSAYGQSFYGASIYS
jgi:hypothetical protein